MIERPVDGRHYPHRGDQIEEWLKMWRDEIQRAISTEAEVAWNLVDMMLDSYRQYSDCGMSLDQKFTDDDDDMTAPPCGPTGDEQFCACGCGGDDSRCRLFLFYYLVTDEQVPDSHTCCKVPGR